MRILIFNLNGRGGMLHYASQLANSLIKKHDVHMIMPRYAVMANPNLHHPDITIYPLKAPTNVLGTILSTINIFQHIACIRYIKKMDFDKIIITDNHPWYLNYGWFFRKKLIVIQHDPHLHMGDLKGFHRWITKFTNYMLRKYARRVFVHGKKLKESITDIPQDKIQSIYHGHYGFFKKGKKQSVIEGDVLFFGRILPYKGVDVLLKSIKLLPNIQFNIVGEINQFYNLKLKKSKDDVLGQGNLYFAGYHIPDDEVASIFKQHKIVVLPYKDASQTGIIPISYAFGKPVIVTDVGALPDMVDSGTGLVIQPNNPVALAGAIKDMLPFAEGMAPACKQFVKDHLDWDKISEEIINATFI